MKTVKTMIKDVEPNK